MLCDSMVNVNFERGIWELYLYVETKLLYAVSITMVITRVQNILIWTFIKNLLTKYQFATKLPLITKSYFKSIMRKKDSPTVSHNCFNPSNFIAGTCKGSFCLVLFCLFVFHFKLAYFELKDLNSILHPTLRLFD